MISTCTMNPSLDYYMEVDGPLERGKPNRSNLEFYEAGGKGINVSIVLNNLGIPTRAFGFVGGFTKDFYISLLAKYQEIRPYFTYIDGHTRINVKCHAEMHTNLNATGPYITDSDMKNLREKVERLGDTDYFVLAGITPEYLEDETADMLKKAIEAGVKVVIDTNPNLMRQVIPAHPFMLKTTDDDLAALVGKELKTKKQIVAAAKQVYEDGVQHVLVLVDNKLAILVYEGGVYEGDVLHHDQFVNTVGTGDSLVAGFLMDYLRSRDVLDSFKYAVSSGAATAYSRGLATRAKIDSFYDQTEIRKLD